MRFRLVALAVLVLAGPLPLLAQALPQLAIDSFPDVSRRAIGSAYNDALAHPNDAPRVGRLAMVLHAWEQFDMAALVYARARHLEPRFDWYYLGGQVATRLADHESAAQLLTEAVRLAPDSLPARLALADALFDAGDSDGAAREYAKLTGGASAPHAHYGLGRDLEARGQHETALTHLQTAVELYPEYGAAWYALGMVQRNLGRMDEATQSLARAQQYGTQWPAVSDPLMDKVHSLREDAASYAERGLALQRQGDSANAIAAYEAAVADNPELASPHVNLIVLYGQQQNWQKAEAHYQAVLRAGTALAEAHYNFAVCLAAQGQHQAAADMFRKALAANPQYANAWSGLARLAEIEGQVDEAEADYREAAEQSPADPLIRFNIARMLIARKQYRDAIAQLEPVASVDHPDRARFLFGLSTAHVLAGEVAVGRQYAVEARDLARSRGQTDLATAIDRDLQKLPQ
jgi:tetratricopeptide (TPR) repeat protein